MKKIHRLAHRCIAFLNPISYTVSFSQARSNAQHAIVTFSRYNSKHSISNLGIIADLQLSKILVSQLCTSVCCNYPQASQQRTICIKITCSAVRNAQSVLASGFESPPRQSPAHNASQFYSRELNEKQTKKTKGKGGTNGEKPDNLSLWLPCDNTVFCEVLCAGG